MKELIKLYGNEREMAYRLGVTTTTIDNWKKDPTNALKKIKIICSDLKLPCDKVIKLLS